MSSLEEYYRAQGEELARVKLAYQKLRRAVEDAYEEGWYDGYNTTSVVGHLPDWEESDTKKELARDI